MSVALIISSSLVALAIGKTIFDNKEDFFSKNSLLYEAYLKRKIDYLWALLLIILIVSSSYLITKLNIPKFMLWSWTSLITQGKGTNVTALPFSSKSIFIVVFFWIALCISLPYLAKIEEEMFREYKTKLMERILNSLKFGLIHMIVGVPLLFCLLISIVGYVFSIFYVKEYNKSKSYDLALAASTSIHLKYNFILVSTLALVKLLLLILRP
jgi:hypothetical protein